MRMLWIALLLPALSYGWQADRIKIRIPGVGEVWSPFWVITCNDGYSVTGLFGDSGPDFTVGGSCLLYTSPSPRDRTRSRMPSSA